MRVLLALAPAALLLAAAELSPAALSDYNPDIDVSAGTLSYFFNSGDDAPPIQTGFFFSGYLNMKSPLFTFFFNSKNFYSTYEAGVAFNGVDNVDDYLLSIPATVELSYRLPVGRRFFILPFLGLGFDVVYEHAAGGNDWSAYYLMDGGLEVKYLIWSDTYLKVKASYGIIFVDTVQSGYVHFLKIRFPVPFIP